MTCYKTLCDRLSKEGYIQYRLGIQGMANSASSKADDRSFLKMLKKTLDPNGILAPGRYEEMQKDEKGQSILI